MLSPTATRKMMQARYSASEWNAWEKANEAVRERQQKYDDDVENENKMHIAGKRMRLDLETPYDIKID